MFKSFHHTAPNTLDNFKWSGFRETSSIPQHLKPIQPSFTNFSNFERKHVPMKPDFAGVYSKDLLNAPKPFQFKYDLSPMGTLNLEGKTPTLSQAIDANNKQKYLDDLKTGLFTGNVSRPITPPPVTPPTSRPSSPPPLMSSSPPVTPQTSRPSSPPPLMPSSSSSSTPNDAIPVMSVVTPAPANEEFTTVVSKKSKSKSKSIAMSFEGTPKASKKQLIIEASDDDEEDALGTDLTPFVELVEILEDFRQQSIILSAKKEKLYAEKMTSILKKFISNPDELLPETLTEIEEDVLTEMMDGKQLFRSKRANKKMDYFRNKNAEQLELIAIKYFQPKPIQKEFDDERTRHAQYT